MWKLIILITHPVFRLNILHKSPPPSTITTPCGQRCHCHPHFADESIKLKVEWRLGSRASWKWKPAPTSHPHAEASLASWRVQEGNRGKESLKNTAGDTCSRRWAVSICLCLRHYHGLKPIERGSSHSDLSRHFTGIQKRGWHWGDIERDTVLALHDGSHLELFGQIEWRKPEPWEGKENGAAPGYKESWEKAGRKSRTKEGVSKYKWETQTRATTAASLWETVHTGGDWWNCGDIWNTAVAMYCYFPYSEGRTIQSIWQEASRQPPGSLPRRVQPCSSFSMIWVYILVTSNLNSYLCEADGRGQMKIKWAEARELRAVCQEAGGAYA